MGLIESIIASIDYDKKRLLHYEILASSTVEGRLNCRWDRRIKRFCYYYKGPDDKKERYVKERPNAMIWKLQTKRFAISMVAVLQNNIALKKQLLDYLLPDSEVDILEKMPKAYRPNSNFKPAGKNRKTKRDIPQSENEYKKEQLTIETSLSRWVLGNKILLS